MCDELCCQVWLKRPTLAIKPLTACTCILGRYALRMLLMAEHLWQHYLRPWQAMASKLYWIAVTALLAASSSVQGHAGAMLPSSEGAVRGACSLFTCALLEEFAGSPYTPIPCAGYRRALLFGLGDVTKAVSDSSSNVVREATQVRTTVASAGTNAVQSSPTWCASSPNAACPSIDCDGSIFLCA